MIFERTSQPALFGTSTLLFAGSAALTATLCASMSDMGGMPMPGGWTMSMAWIPMPGQTWLGAAGSFVGVCAVMMVSMMLPVAGAHAVAVSPDDWRFRQNTPELADGAGGRRILCCLVLVWNCRIPFRCGACRDRDATAHAGESRSHGCGCGRHARRHAAIQRVESASPCLLPEPFVHEHRLAGECFHGLATGVASQLPMHFRLRWLYGDPPCSRGHLSEGDGPGHGGNHCRTARCGWSRTAPGCRGSRDRIDTQHCRIRLLERDQPCTNTKRLAGNTEDETRINSSSLSEANASSYRPRGRRK